ncbi:hypothetical protein BS47DRAFT_1342340 [Hydnum rufescens UP504]|uniref:Uncharacterized protein n=1 Tax=Hydnum rufescens UP504 TaxID=1448309 RepID=A0A9P6DY09_9AGAM|nr:hypothetical protein BS47DRAFT_1342340 [Hydnum rufescens UP504]
MACTNNSGSWRAHHVDLDLLRQDPIDHYPKVKAMLPLFVSEKAWAEDERGREWLTRVAISEEYRNIA